MDKAFSQEALVAIQEALVAIQEAHDSIFNVYEYLKHVYAANEKEGLSEEVLKALADLAACSKEFIELYERTI